MGKYPYNLKEPHRNLNSPSLMSELLRQGCWAQQIPGGEVAALAEGEGRPTWKHSGRSGNQQKPRV